MSTFSENQAMKPTDGGMISYRWPGLQLALSLYTRLKRAETSRGYFSTSLLVLPAGLTCRLIVLQIFTETQEKTEKQERTADDLRQRAQSKHPEPRTRTVLWQHASCSDWRLFVRRCHVIMWLQLHVFLSQHFVLFKHSRPARLCCVLQDGVRNSCWLSEESETSHEDVTRWGNRKTN